MCWIQEGLNSLFIIRCGIIQCVSIAIIHGAKVWHSNDAKYRRVIFRCNRKYKDGRKCATPHVTEDQIRQLFTAAINRLIGNKREILSNLAAICDELYDVKTLEAERDRLNAELIVLTEAFDQMVAENAHVAQDQEEYQKRHAEVTRQYDATKAEFNAVCERIANTLSQRSMLLKFIDTLRQQKDLVTEFDATLWATLLDHMTVYSKEDMRFTFRDGTVIRV